MACSGYYRPPQQSELAVFTRAKELSKAVFVVTQDAPNIIFPQPAIYRKGLDINNRYNIKLHNKSSLTPGI